MAKYFLTFRQKRKLYDAILELNGKIETTSTFRGSKFDISYTLNTPNVRIFAQNWGDKEPKMLYVESNGAIKNIPVWNRTQGKFANRVYKLLQCMYIYQSRNQK